MSINTKFQLAVLTVETGIQSGEIGDGFQIFFCGFIFVFETTFVAFGTRPTKVVVIAEFIACCTALDLVEDRGVDGNGRIETSWAGNP